MNRPKKDAPRPRTDTRPAGGRAASPLRRPAALLAVLVVLVAVVTGITHRRVLTASAISMNDGTYVTQNDRVQNPSWRHAGLFLVEVAQPTTVEGYYQPLAMISLMLDSAMGGGAEDLAAYHRTSLALHMANTVLVIVLLYLLFGRAVPAALAGLLFGVHPMAVEVIAWLGERKTALATFFALWTLILHVGYARRGGWKLYAACLAAFVLALMSKPTVTPLPLLLLLLDYWPLRRLSRHALIEKVPLLAVAGMFAVITVISQRHVELTSRQEITAGQHLLIACHNLLFYPLKMVWPVPLSTVYPFPEPIGLSNRMVLAGVVTTMLAVAGVIVSLRWTRGVVTGLLFFLIALSPTLMNVGYAMGVAADKYAYLPSIGLLLMATWGLSRLWEQGPGRPRENRPDPLFLLRLVIVGVGVVAGAGYAVAAHRYLGKWQDTGVYCEHILSIAPETAWVHHNLASHRIDQNRIEDAVRHCREAVRLAPENHKALVTLGEALVRQNNHAEAIQQFERALAIRPDSPEAHNALGMARGTQGQWDEATRHFEAARKVWPNSPQVLFNLGTAYLHAGRFEQASACLREVLRYRPDHPEVLDRLAQLHFEQGQALAREGKVGEALPHFKKVVELRPTASQAWSSLGHAYANLDRIEEALDAFREVIRTRPTDPEPHCAIGDMLARKGNASGAAEAYRRALVIDPTHEHASRQLAAALDSPITGTQPP